MSYANSYAGKINGEAIKKPA